jgi:formate-dependent nitrite reductase membrane component NrfD
MEPKLKRALSVAALIFVGIFTLSYILYLFNHTMLNGAVAIIMIASLAAGAPLTALVLVVNKRENAERQQQSEEQPLDEQPPKEND